MLRWYAQRLTEETHGRIDVRTPAGFELATRLLHRLQSEKYASEPMVPEWSFPAEIRLRSVPNMTFPVIDVVLPEEWVLNNILYLDFDESWVRDKK